MCTPHFRLDSVVSHHMESHYAVSFKDITCNSLLLDHCLFCLDKFCEKPFVRLSAIKFDVGQVESRLRLSQGHVFLFCFCFQGKHKFTLSDLGRMFIVSRLAKETYVVPLHGGLKYHSL